MADRNEAQRTYWNSASGRSWVDRQAELDSMHAPVADLIIEAAGLQPGQSVLDIGCGAGATTIAAAAAVSPSGHVTGFDISEPLVEAARARATDGGLSNITVDVADVQTVSVAQDERFDAAISRFGLMFFDDPGAAFSNINSLLLPGAILTFSTWAPVDHNPWFRLPMQVAVDRLGKPAPSDPDAPGPLAFRDRARVEGILTGAGFAIERSEAVDIHLPLPGGTAAGVALARYVGPVSRLLKEKDGTEEDKQAIFDSLHDQFKPFEADGFLRIPARINLFQARAG